MCVVLLLPTTLLRSGAGEMEGLDAGKGEGGWGLTALIVLLVGGLQGSFLGRNKQFAS